MRTEPIRWLGHGRWCLVTLVALTTLAGCSTSSTQQEFDSEQARHALKTALEAWKDGQAAGLSRRQPPIRFVDDDYLAGWQLVEFTIMDPEKPIRPFEMVEVKLRLRDRQGKVVERTTGYQITIHPRIAVLRMGA